IRHQDEADASPHPNGKSPENLLYRLISRRLPEAKPACAGWTRRYRIIFSNPSGDNHLRWRERAAAGATRPVGMPAKMTVVCAGAASPCYPDDARHLRRGAALTSGH
ncbi:MAG: hypothetical protein RMJ55_18920, partial [Roseiflexaceae bacterium]|nr:hypothetical protein [Roseiflexaceae bacterium]